MPWYYVENGQQAGPVSESDFEGLVSSGKVSPETLVWKEGMENWLPYSQVRSPEGAFAGTSPASPYGGAASFGATTSNYGNTGATSTGEMVSCNECGRYFPPDEVIRYGTMNVCAACKPAFVQRIKEGGSASAGAMDYAGFWIRFVARIIDGLITGLVVGIVMMATGFSFDPQSWVGGAPTLSWTATITSMVFPFLYEAIMLSRFGATLGKLALKLRVVDASGAPLAPRQVFGRSAWMHWITIIPFVGSLVLLIGCIMAAFDDEKRALQDRLVQTRVIRN